MIARVCTSRAENGSSRSNRRGSLISVCAKATRFLMPPESWCGKCFSKPVKPTFPIHFWTSGVTSFSDIPRKRGPAATLFATFIQGKVASCWKTKPVLVSISFTSFSSTVTVPKLGNSKPETRVRAVDFPHPVGPTSETNSPGWISKSNSLRA